MSDLPKGWYETTVGSMSQDISYGFTTSASSTPKGPKFLRITDIQNGTVDWKAVPFCKVPPSDASRFLLKAGDIVFARTGATTGKSFLIRAAPNAVFASYLIRLRPSECIMPELMAYFFQSQMYWQQITENLSGSAQPNCNATKLSSLALPIPPLNEQSRIVAKLEKLLGRVDAAQARLATIPRILKRFRQSVLAAACSGRLTADWRTQNPNGEPTSALLERIRKQRRTSLRFGDAEADSNTNDLPESWLVVKIEELTSIQNGRAFPSKQYAQDGVRLLRPGNLTVNGQVEWNDKNTACLPKQWIKDYPEFLLGTGELLMNLTAQSLKDEFLGRVCIKSDSVPALLNQRIARFVNQGSDDLRPYLFIYFKSPQFRSYVNTLDTGSLIRHMHSKQVLSHVAPLPPLAEQQEIVRRVEALFKTVDALEARYRKAQAHVDKLTQSLLAKAFRGELVPQDLSDEPASVLLERIRMERNGTEPKKRGRRK